jgi:hypothetical protein
MFAVDPENLSNDRDIGEREKERDRESEREREREMMMIRQIF